MKKITAKYIVENITAMAYGQHVTFRGSEFWMHCEQGDNGKYDPANGVIYYISADRKISGSVNGHEFAKVIDGVAYKI